MQEEFLKVIDILGTVAFAASGVYAAMQKRLDVFGVLIIAFVTAVGGGTVRDIMVGDTPVSWIRNINYSIIILCTAVVVISFKSSIFRNFKKTLLVFDSIGLGFFTILGIQKGLMYGYCYRLLWWRDPGYFVKHNSAHFRERNLCHCLYCRRVRLFCFNVCFNKCGNH